jgi:ABC-type antimicrobial peptide transport system permease subunit
MALGADAAATLRLVMQRSAALIAMGTVFGLVASVAAARVIAGLLYAVTPVDPIVFAGVSSLLAAAGLAATFIPARRATRVDPIVALKVD